MYLQHFGLAEAPFSITPDTAFFFSSPRHQDALNILLLAAQAGEGFIKVTGEVGTGKTLLCRKFLASLSDDFVTAYLPNPYLEPHTLLLALADELELDLPGDIDQHHLLKALNQALITFAANNKNVLICLDEAQAMPFESLETLRLLTNLETEKRKLLQIVLFGQPELDEKLNSPSIRQLKQRIVFQTQLYPLNADELHNYLATRLQTVGYRGEGLFTPAALVALYRNSGGTPRLINLICHKALILVYGEGRQLIDARHIHAATRDTPAAKHPWSWLLNPKLWFARH